MCVVCVQEFLVGHVHFFIYFLTLFCSLFLVLTLLVVISKLVAPLSTAPSWGVDDDCTFKDAFLGKLLAIVVVFLAAIAVVASGLFLASQYYSKERDCYLLGTVHNVTSTAIVHALCSYAKELGVLFLVVFLFLFCVMLCETVAKGKIYECSISEGCASQIAFPCS